MYSFSACIWNARLTLQCYLDFDRAVNAIEKEWPTNKYRSPNVYWLLQHNDFKCTTCLCTSINVCWCCHKQTGRNTLRGPQIPIQATAAGRSMDPEKVCSTKRMSFHALHLKTQYKLCYNRHMMPVRRKPKGKRPHSLVEIICAGEQNAGKW